MGNEEEQRQEAEKRASVTETSGSETGPRCLASSGPDPNSLAAHRRGTVSAEEPGDLRS